jgi:hypothetical protein
MWKIVIVVAALAVVMAHGGPASAQCKQTASIEYVTAKDLPSGPMGPAPRAECELFKMIVDDSIVGYSSGLVTHDRIVSYFDPAECGDPNHHYEITSLSFTLLDPPNAWDPRDYKWPVLVDVVVYQPYSISDSCLGPGTEVCRIPLLCDSATWAFPKVGTAVFPTPCCVNGPFFIGLEYTDPSTERLPSIMFDYSSDPDTCHLFMYICDSIWVGWYAFWVTPPGYPFYWVGGETQSEDCCYDADADGVCWYDDNCPSVPNPLQEDWDGDGTGDACDDSDSDGVPDNVDNCRMTPNSLQENADGDGLGDLCDNCPYASNPQQIDTDLDGLGNVCDPDDDDDGHLDEVDNCPLTPNPGQEDSDLDGVGDACECMGTVGNVDCDPTQQVTMSDLTVLIDHLFISFAPLCNMDEADVDQVPPVTMSDLTVL